MADWRALTLHQPWASAIAEGIKSIETRHWGTTWRGWVAIHAGVKKPDTMRLGDWWCEPTWGTEFGLLNEAGQPHVLPLGAVVAVARLVDVVPTGSDDEPIRSGFAYVAADEQLRGWTRDAEDVVWVGSAQEPWGDYTPGRWAWLLSDVIKLPEPIPAKGKQGLWKPDDELTEQLEAVVAA